MVVQFTIPVANVDALLALTFSRIEIWRSTDQGNSYQEVTASSAQPASLEAALPQTQYRMGGHELRFAIDGGAEQTVSFNTVVDYWTAEQVRDAVNAVAPGVASVGSDGGLVLTSSTTGRNSEVQITYNDATDLGWQGGETARGLDPRIVLVSGTLTYLYQDLGGSTTDWYKWRFSADGVNPISDFGPVITGDTPPLNSAVSLATATFLDLTGQPMQRKIIIVPDDDTQSLNGGIIGGSTPMVVQADVNGFLQVPLLKGAKVRVGIEGTAFVREITVPSTVTFDLLSALAAAPDPFSVQSPAPFLVRRSI